MSFLDDLRERQERARKRVEHLRLSLAEAQKEFESWTVAILFEENSTSSRVEHYGTLSGLDPETQNQWALDAPKISFSPEEIRSKRGVLLGYFRSLNGPVRSSELEKLVKPAMSRASLYAMLKVLEEEGMIGRDEEKRYVLKRTDEKEITIAETS